MITTTERKKMIHELREKNLSRKKLRLALIAMSMAPHLPTQIRCKAMLTKMDAQDVTSGKISKKAFVIKRTLRFIPLGGLTMAAFDTGSELLSEAEF